MRMSDKGWLVVNIGCIECGVSSAVVGLFETEAEADAVADRCNLELGWRGGGQNRYIAWPVPDGFGYCDERYQQSDPDAWPFGGDDE